MEYTDEELDRLEEVDNNDEMWFSRSPKWLRDFFSFFGIRSARRERQRIRRRRRKQNDEE